MWHGPGLRMMWHGQIAGHGWASTLPAGLPLLIVFKVTKRQASCLLLSGSAETSLKSEDRADQSCHQGTRPCKELLYLVDICESDLRHSGAAAVVSAVIFCLVSKTTGAGYHRASECAVCSAGSPSSAWFDAFGSAKGLAKTTQHWWKLRPWEVGDWH